MSRFRKLVLAAAATVSAGPAFAECTGQDYLGLLERANPALVARMEAESAAVPYAEGRFWRIEKDGRVSHAFGTFHSADPRIAAVPPALERLLKAATLVLVEILPEEQDRMQALMAQNPGMVLNTGGPTLDRLLSPGELRALEGLLAPYGVPMQAAVQMQPWFLNMLMATPACMMKDMAAGAEVLDGRVVRTARAARVRVEGLERIETALEVFRTLAPDRQIDLLRMNILAGDLSESVTVSTQRLYMAEETWRIWALNAALAEALGLGAELRPMLDQFYRVALVERNRDWLPAIRRALEAGDAVIAVGALHLAGPDSLQAMLEREGWRITRLGPDGEPLAPAEAPMTKTPASRTPAAPADRNPDAKKTK